MSCFCLPTESNLTQRLMFFRKMLWMLSHSAVSAKQGSAAPSMCVCCVSVVVAREHPASAQRHFAWSAKRAMIVPPAFRPSTWWGGSSPSKVDSSSWRLAVRWSRSILDLVEIYFLDNVCMPQLSRHSPRAMEEDGREPHAKFVMRKLCREGMRFLTTWRLA
jgi:hypothetical protein